MKKFLLFTTLCCLVFSISSCNNDDEPDVDDYPETPIIANNLITLTYEDFITEDDVLIISPDTTTISINNELLNQKEISINSGDVLCIWQKINRIPFIRIVKSVSTDGSETIVTSSPGDISDIFSDANINLSSEIYINSLQSSTDKYICEEKEYHPAVIIWEDPGVQGGTQGGKELSYLTAEQILSRSIKWGAERTFYPNIKIGNDTLNLSLNGEIITRLGVDMNISIKWFSLKNFSCSFTGELDANLPISLNANVEGEISKEVELCKIPSYTFVFWVSAIPVAVTLDSSLDFEAKTEVNASCKFELPINFYYRYQRGTSYTSSNGWYKTNNDVAPTLTCDLKNISATGVLESTSTASITFKTGVYLYGLAGPYLEISPTLTADASITGNATLNNSSLKLATSGKASIDGTIGAEFKVAKWTLSKQIFPFTICSYTLWDWEKEYIIN